MTAWNHVVRNRDKYMEGWEKKLESPLAKIRAKQMISLTAEGLIKTAVPELISMTLEKIVVHDMQHFTVCFLDGTKKEILV